MKGNMSEQDIVNRFLDRSGEVALIPVSGTFIKTIHRHDGGIERQVLPNIVTALGLNHLASRGIADTGSKYNWIGVGTGDYTPHINSQYIGEASRKAAAVVGSSRELIILVATWGGAADSVTSNDLEMAGIANHQTAGSGHFLNVANGLATVLADSDFLHLEVQVRVGSHAIGA